MNPETLNRLKSVNITPTAMRILVLDIMLNSEKALNFYELEQKFDNVERSTLYRTLKIFEEKHLIHPISDGTGAIKYAICKQNCQCTPQELHVHFYCIKCDITYCLHDIAIPSVSMIEGYIVQTATYLLKGICPSCK